VQSFVNRLKKHHKSHSDLTSSSHTNYILLLHIFSQSLAYWVVKQRVQYSRLKKGLPSEITQDRVDRLNEIGFCWSASRTYNKQDLVSRNEKKSTSSKKRPSKRGATSAKKKKHPPPQNNATGGFSLRNDTWAERYEQLLAYRDRHGNIDVPTKNGSLGRWIRWQRFQYKALQKGEKSQMTQDRVDKLNEVGFQWTA